VIEYILVFGPRYVEGDAIGKPHALKDPVQHYSCHPPISIDEWVNPNEIRVDVRGHFDCFRNRVYVELRRPGIQLSDQGRRITAVGDQLSENEITVNGTIWTENKHFWAKIATADPTSMVPDSIEEAAVPSLDQVGSVRMRMVLP